MAIRPDSNYTMEYVSMPGGGWGGPFPFLCFSFFYVYTVLWSDLADDGLSVTQNMYQCFICDISTEYDGNQIAITSG